MMESKIIEKFKLIGKPDKKGYNDLYLERLTPGKEKDLGKASVGKFYHAIWNLGDDERVKDPEKYISVIQREKWHTAWLRMGEKMYKAHIPKELPVEFALTEKDEHVKHSITGKWEKK